MDEAVRIIRDAERKFKRDEGKLEEELKHRGDGRGGGGGGGGGSIRRVDERDR